MDFVHRERPAARVAGMAQPIERIARDLVLRIGAVQGPGERHVAGTREAGELIDVAAGLVQIHPGPEPQHRVDAQVAAQRLLDVSLETCRDCGSG